MPFFLPSGAASAGGCIYRGHWLRADTAEPLARARVMLTSAEAPVPGATRPAPKTVTTDGSGKFVVKDVEPGRYNLSAQRNGYVRMSYGQRDSLRSQVPVDVANTDVEGITITLRPGFPIHGRMFMDGQPAGTIDPFRNPLQNARPFFRAIGGETDGAAGAPPIVNADGTFTQTAILPGRYQITLGGLPPDYFVKAIRLQNTDLLRDGLTLDRPLEGTVDILVSPNGGRIDGRALNKESKPVGGVQVVLIPRERERNEQYRIAFTDQNGQFTIRGIVPDPIPSFRVGGNRAQRISRS
ncbi:MAG: carboxypeptidase regulatory-like domain-containing protein [Acidobacteria bacterium]|nr:carboxypeptidase regulatory-like domain-containing protein [Acidobacteriota bacterium]